MTSVVGRIKEVQQPRGGYVSAKSFETRYLGGDGPSSLDHLVENVSPGLVGLAVDYLTRWANGAEPEDAFGISLMGAERLGPAEATAAELALEELERGRIDGPTVRAACRLVNYDVAYRVGPRFYNGDANTTPDMVTQDHISQMVQRSLIFIREYGPITLDGFTFEGGYTELVQTGDGDFLTADTLWEFKVSAAGPKSDHTLQALMYYLMGKRSVHPEFESVAYLGIFNPRLNALHRLAVAAIAPAIVAEVERDVMGYR